MAKRVVITGVGAVTGLGVGAAALWEGLCAGRSCLRPIERFDASGFHSRLGGEVKDFSAKDYVPKHYRKAVKVMARDIELAIAAAREAAADAGLVTREAADGEPAATTYPAPRMGCHIGAGLIAAEAEELAGALVTARDARGDFDVRQWGQGKMDNLTPLWLLKYLPNMLACHVTIIHGCEGPSNTITCAEASGLLSLGESRRVIERGAADVCFSGGAESKINLMGILRMEFAGRLAATGTATDGSTIVRPFDPDSPGGLLGEAAGIVMLESEPAARARGARIYAEIVGFGAAHSPMRPGWKAGAPMAEELVETDEGFQYAIENALDDAKLSPTDIDAVVLLGSGVPAMDMGEAGGLKAVFGSRQPPVVTLGPNVGDTMAGAGGVLAVVAAMCVKEQKLPARINAGTPASGIDAGACAARGARLERVLVASSSLGGQNAALVLQALR